MTRDVADWSNTEPFVTGWKRRLKCLGSADAAAAWAGTAAAEEIVAMAATRTEATVNFIVKGSG